MKAPPNKDMKLSKPEYLAEAYRIRPVVIQAGFAAYAQCYPDLKPELPETHPRGI